MAGSETSRVWQTIPLILIVTLSCPIANSKVIYVDDDAVGANNGTSWENAYKFLQNALADAKSAEKPVEIRVAQGIYKPDQGEKQTPGERNETFQLINGVTLAGGYAGVGYGGLDRPDPNQRDIELYETILSGDLNGDDVEVIDPCDLIDEPTRTENSYHVVTGNFTDETAVLKGFTITGGNANGDSEKHGGGIIIEESNPTLTNCTFSGNSAEWDGGGMCNKRNSSPILTNCTFSGNLAKEGGGICNYGDSPTLTNCTFSGNAAELEGGGMCNRSDNPILTNNTFTSNSAVYGGGISNYGSSPTLTDCTFNGNSGSGMRNYDSNPILTNCTFSRNLTKYDGGGMRNDESNPILTNCTFKENSARGEGGGMWNCSSSSILTDCTFSGNWAEWDGGGMYNSYGSPILTNCTFSGNSARHGGGITYGPSNPILTNCTFAHNSALNGNALACDSDRQEGPSNVELINCILWEGGNEIWNNDNSTIIVTYSNIRIDYPGEGNIDADPLFVDPGYWDTNETPDDPNDDFWVDGDYRLTPCSPCIDSGDPNYISEPNDTDMDGNSRVMGGRIDMGAYEYPFIYDKSDAGTIPGSWWKYSENPIFSIGESGQWDSRITSISVLKDHKEPVDKYKMWYVGGNQFIEGAGIGYATSPDGINWNRYENNPVLEPVEWWNTSGFSGICVIKDGSVYKLWYEGVDNQNTARIGYAASSDGINWDINNNPVFSPGYNDAWDNEDVGNPCVIKEGSTYKMWYWGDNKLNEIDQIGLAVSHDGIKWQRAASNPVVAPDPSIWWQNGEGIGTPHVIRVNSGYIMAYHAADQLETIRIGLAMSSDGLAWKQEHNPILDLGTDKSWDSIGIVTGSLIQDSSHYKLWYLGIDASEIIRVGLAVSCDNIIPGTKAGN